MHLLTSKWMIVVYILLALVIILFLTGKKSVHAEIIVNTSPDRVWEVLMDQQSYNNWSTVLIPTDGVFHSDSTVTYDMIDADGKSTSVKTRVVELRKNEVLNQYGGTRGILTVDHRYILERAESGTKVIIHEDYRGIMVNFWNPGWVQKGYEQTLVGLKAYIEGSP